MNGTAIGATLVGLMLSVGCSTDTPRPAPTPQPASVADTSPRVSADTVVKVDTAALDSVNIVSQATLDTTRCAARDTTPKSSNVSEIDAEEITALRTSNAKASSA